MNRTAVRLCSLSVVVCGFVDGSAEESCDAGRGGFVAVAGAGLACGGFAAVAVVVDGAGDGVGAHACASFAVGCCGGAGLDLFGDVEDCGGVDGESAGFVVDVDGFFGCGVVEGCEGVVPVADRVGGDFSLVVLLYEGEEAGDVGAVHAASPGLSMMVAACWNAFSGPWLALRTFQSDWSCRGGCSRRFLMSVSRARS